MGAAPIYHICRREEWETARAAGRYSGSSQDAADGFIHFSTAAQVEESAARHRAGQSGLVLLAVDPDALGTALKWEPSRRGVLFPHLYGDLPVAALHGVWDLPLGPDSRHLFPAAVLGAAVLGARVLGARVLGARVLGARVLGTAALGSGDSE